MIRPIFASLAILACSGQVLATPRSNVHLILVDDEQAVFTGEWTLSAKQRALIGKGYRHDGNTGRGEKSAVFTPDIPEAGRYEVRVLYTSGASRSSRVPVTVRSADGEKTVIINQRKEPQPLGVFQFDAGTNGSVTVSNKDADSFVVVDAVELKTRSGGLKPPPREPVQLAKDAKPSDVDGKSFDLVVIGATPGGIACAVRAAREGLSVLLVQHNRHIGGMLANGLMQWDALYGGPRAPIFNQYAKMIEEHYRKTYGEKSSQYRQARYTQEHYPMSRFEPSVAEREFNRLVAAEKNITLLLGHYPSAVERDGAMLRSVALRECGAGLQPATPYGQVANLPHTIRVRATMFADGTYEGDLAALAKVPYRVGREGRDEYGEPHAGKIFTNIKSARGPRDAVEGRLNLHPYGHVQGSIDPNSPHTADRAIQAYNYRFCLTDEDGNRRLPEKPPGYKREEYVNYYRLGMSAGALNGKSSFNSAILPGENYDYPEADWPTREKIIERHKNFALGLMYFLQNDESVRAGSRARFRQIGLPLDEYTDNNNIPYEMYVREARRIVGRHVFTEHDNRLAKDYARTPIMPDSVAITDWSMDSHDCSWDRSSGYAFDGKLILTEESRPAQVPWRSLLPQNVNNLIVPVCLSATHVAWGAVRLEPVFMQTGEAAGFAAALSKKHGVTPAALNSDLLVRTLCKAGCVVSFFNEKEALQPAAQYFGTKGFFHDYNARLNEPLKTATAKLWADAKLDPNTRARAVAEAEKSAETGTLARGAVLQKMWELLQ
ncbi:MAG: FAD-dependent oxidoreductase [Verrucomicrobia bacterium]|nr:FAD-dependent oxidoreductase [Verrucomicrobiota bacterium]